MKEPFDWNFKGYKDKRGKWRWRLTASNGKIVGASSQGFADKRDCIQNARTLGGVLVNVTASLREEEKE